LIEDSPGIRLPPLGITLKNVCFSDEHTVKYSSLSPLGFTQPLDQQTGTCHSSPNKSMIIFVFDFFIVFHDYKTRRNQYLQKADVDSKGFAS